MTTTQEKQVAEKPKLTSTQLDLIEREIEIAGGEQKWFIAKGAMRKYPDGSLAVVMKPDGTIPYENFAEQANQVKTRKARREYAERERIYQQTGQYPISPALQKLKANIGRINKNTQTHD